MSAHVLLTGATGFLGKVVLEELMRRRDELRLARVYVVIRPQKEKSARERLAALTKSPCFADLPRGWDAICTPIECDLSGEEGLAAALSIAPTITHIIHCAASVDFELPVAEAARTNITSSLNVLDLAHRCPSLRRMVSVSTAYVTPHRRGPIDEALAPLPRPATSFYADMQTALDDADDQRLLAETGHPNTYTLTKCVAEHLLAARHGDVPLTILRPSIVSASRQFPQPGWIDSRAALAGFVTLIGLGHLRAVVVDSDARLDVIAVDDVAERIIASTFDGDTRPLVIRHAVAGRAQSNTIATYCRVITNFFSRYPNERRAVLHYAGKRSLAFRAHDALHHRLPLAVASLSLRLKRKKKAQRAVERLGETIQGLHHSFPYFTQNTFDFRSSMPLPAEFSPETYAEIVCSGVYRNILKKDERQVTVAGRAHAAHESDVEFAATQPRGNATVRALGYLVRKGLRKCVESVTIDQQSLEAALAQVPRGAAVVIVPSHRSYMDFLLAPLVFFARPELGIAPPQIAAAVEFSRIPLLGKIFERAGAFFVERGVGRANAALNQKLQALVASRSAMMFFIEGKRSRDRRFVAPKTGILRALQAAGAPVVLLPIAVSYDRVPEEQALLGEIRSGKKPGMGLGPLVKWAGKLLRGKVSLGRVHLAAGAPIRLGSEDDVKAIARDVMGELQKRTVTTTHHLDAFLRRHPLRGVDRAWLAAAIKARGGEVLDSKLPVEDRLELDAEECLRRNWMHFFYNDALALFAHHPEIVAAIDNEHYLPRSLATETPSDPRLVALLRALFNIAPDVSFATPAGMTLPELHLSDRVRPTA